MKEEQPRTPKLYLLAGPNGAGKTTFASRFLPEFVDCREFLNADLIAKGLSPFAPETQNVRAARLLLERIAELSEARADFGIETTLSGRTYLKLLRNMRELGYRIGLFFLWVPSAEIAVARVATRVSQGGHNVPVEDIRRRYVAGVRNFFGAYEASIDDWWLYNAWRLPPQFIASRVRGALTIEQKRQYRRFEKQGKGSHEKER